MLYRSLRYTGKKKNKKTKILLGYSFQELNRHLSNCPNWELVKKENWHLDHVFPIKAFMDYGIKNLKIINCLENLRPVPAKSNLCKQGVYSKNDFEIWLSSRGIIWH